MHKTLFYLYIIYVLKSFTCFKHCPVYLQEVYAVTVYIYSLWYRHSVKSEYLDDWLTVHRSITLVNFQLDAQNSYLFIYFTFIKILYMFRALPCSSSGGLRLNCIHAASGIVTVCR
jgi:hypothetical protein